MKVEVHRFQDGRLQLRIKFEEDTNFRAHTLTWVPRKDELSLINDSLQAIDEYNHLKTNLAEIYQWRNQKKEGS